MKNYYHLTTTAFLIFLVTSAFSQKAEVINIQKLVKNKGVEVFNRELSLINEGTHQGIRLSKDEGEGIAWLKGIEFSEGTLEFDVRGENVANHSFVGIAFHGKDNATFDAIYLRPFRFKDQNEEQRSHQLQYISLPDFPWRTLREKFPHKYESAIANTPDPDSWVRIKVVVKGSTVSTYINDNKEPSLVVEKVTSFNKGAVGFYVADTSGGDFANITISKAN